MGRRGRFALTNVLASKLPRMAHVKYAVSLVTIVDILGLATPISTIRPSELWIEMIQEDGTPRLARNPPTQAV